MDVILKVRSGKLALPRAAAGPPAETSGFIRFCRQGFGTTFSPDTLVGQGLSLTGGAAHAGR